MTPQLTKIAECLSESHAREIKLARCLAESLKRIQTLESSAKTKDTKAKATELRFNAAVRDLAEQLAKQNAENEELIRKMEEAIKVEFPAQLAALKAEFATPAAQAAAPQSFNPRGDYEAGEKYKPFDFVSSNGSSYIALVENPTQPPSKKSKQWMLVAARGAGGGGDTSGLLSKAANLSDLTDAATARTNLGLGTAATLNVGQSAGNLLELTGDGEVSLGDNGGAQGVLRIYDNDLEDYSAVRSVNGSLTINTNPIALLSQVGDRYLTSSTTSNTVSNGAKTFTVGTGLAYSPTQDVTIVFDASHHMHGSVTSYNSATGVLVVDVNHNTGSGTYAVWTVNVGGIGAGAIPSGGTTGQVLAKVSDTNYDDAWVTPTVAVGDVTGLGTGVATALAVNAGSAGAFVRTTDTATTTTAGVVAGIGIASPQAPVGTNVAYISQVGAIGRNFSSFLYTDFLTGGASGLPGSASDGFIFGTGQSGTGAAVSKLNSNISGRAGILVLTTGTTATGYAAIDTWSSSNTYRYNDGQTVFETSVRLPVLSDATNEYIFYVGGSPQNNGVLGNEGAMFVYNRALYGANWQAASRAGGSQTTTNTNTAVVANTWVRLALVVNETGTSIAYYIDGALVATITTNIQASGASREGSLLVKTAGTTSVTANIDYYFLGKTFTTAR